VSQLFEYLCIIQVYGAGFKFESGGQLARFSMEML